jgi:hypothetical protein
LRPLQGKDQISVCKAVLSTWDVASSVATPDTSCSTVHNSLNSLLNATTSSGSSSGSSSCNLWRQVPSLARALPAVAALTHHYLLLPYEERFGSNVDAGFFTETMALLQGLVQGAAAAKCESQGAAATTTTTSSSSSRRTPEGIMQQQRRPQQGHSPRAATAEAGREQQPQPDAPSFILQDETMFPEAARAQVRAACCGGGTSK